MVIDTGMGQFGRVLKFTQLQVGGDEHGLAVHQSGVPWSAYTLCTDTATLETHAPLSYK